MLDGNYTTTLGAFIYDDPFSTWGGGYGAQYGANYNGGFLALETGKSGGGTFTEDLCLCGGVVQNCPCAETTTVNDAADRAFVVGLYRELLGREPKLGLDDIQFWLDYLKAHGRDAVRAGFLASDEYKAKHPATTDDTTTTTPATTTSFFDSVKAHPFLAGAAVLGLVFALKGGS